MTKEQHSTVLDRPADRPAREAPANMMHIPGGTFRMGSDKHYPEEAPVHRVTVDGFCIDRTPVTNRQFKEFVKRDRPCHLRRDRARAEGLSRRAAAHALCRLAGVHAAARTVDLRDWGQWWTFLKGADWRHPYGPKSNINALDNHPVVHVAFADALAYATLGRQGACRPRRNGSSRRAAVSTAPNLPGATSSRPAASTWPIPGRANSRAQNLADDGFERTSPVDGLPAERLWPPRHDRQCLGMDHRLVSRRSTKPMRRRPAAFRKIRAAGARTESYDPCQPDIKIPRKVIKGGSHLCAPNYCRRYRPAARHAEPVDTSTSHLSFRCIVKNRQVKPRQCPTR